MTITAIGSKVDQIAHAVRDLNKLSAAAGRACTTPDVDEANELFERVAALMEEEDTLQQAFPIWLERQMNEDVRLAWSEYRVEHGLRYTPGGFCGWIVFWN